MNTPLKTCITCREAKDVSAFGLRLSQKDGLATICKSCRGIYRRKLYAAMSPEQKERLQTAKVQVACSDCDQRLWKTPSSVKTWQGRCRSCAQIFEKNKPEIKAQLSGRAREQVIRQGGIPNARHFTTEMVIGSANPHWKGGITPRHQAERGHASILAWRKAVLTRDQFTCQLCGQIGGKLNVHHLLSWAEFKELRSDVNNGITLCYSCHFNRIHQGNWHNPGLPIGDTWAMVAGM